MPKDWLIERVSNPLSYIQAKLTSVCCVYSNEEQVTANLQRWQYAEEVGNDLRFFGRISAPSVLVKQIIITTL